MATKQFTFGPGALEDITLHLWRRKGDGDTVVRAHAVGTYRVYCGHGLEHIEAVDITSPLGVCNDAVGAYQGNENALRAIALVLVGWWLEEHYSDPCEAFDGDEDPTW